jgi:hypothetical protein
MCMDYLRVGSLWCISMATNASSQSHSCRTVVAIYGNKCSRNVTNVQTNENIECCFDVVDVCFKLHVALVHWLALILASDEVDHFRLQPMSLYQHLCYVRSVPVHRHVSDPRAQVRHRDTTRKAKHGANDITAEIEQHSEYTTRISYSEQLAILRNGGVRVKASQPQDPPTHMRYQSRTIAPPQKK